MSFKTSLQTAYETKIDDLQKEIESYSKDENLWKVTDGITNSGGNLCLHLIGNLNHFIGALLGNTGYVREREKEFSDSGVSKGELLGQIEEVRKVVVETIESIEEEAFDKEYPETIFDSPKSNGEVLAYMSGHLSYHLGQINYHRRILDK